MLRFPGAVVVPKLLVNPKGVVVPWLLVVPKVLVTFPNWLVFPNVGVVLKEVPKVVLVWGVWFKKF